MRKRTISFDVVRKIGLTLPGVEESVAWGVPALKLRGKLLACVPSHRSAEPGSLVIRISFSERAALLAEAPEVYYITEHYTGYTAVLVRLARVNENILKDLLGMAHRFVASSAGPRSTKAKRRTSRR